MSPEPDDTRSWRDRLAGRAPEGPAADAPPDADTTGTLPGGADGETAAISAPPAPDLDADRTQAIARPPLRAVPAVSASEQADDAATTARVAMPAADETTATEPVVVAEPVAAEPVVAEPVVEVEVVAEPRPEVVTVTAAELRAVAWAASARYLEASQDLAGLTEEMRRRQRWNGDLLRRKSDELLALGAEARRTHDELDFLDRTHRLSDGGFAGECVCGQPFFDGAVYCSRCGRTLVAGAETV